MDLCAAPAKAQGLRPHLKTACCAAALLLAAPAPGAAQQVSSFTGDTVFGDSYADVTLLNQAPNCPAQYPQCRFSNGTNFTDSLNSAYGLTSTNYALGGAQAGDTNIISGLTGFTQQVDRFAAAGRIFGPRDLVTISVGGNDQGFLSGSFSPDQIQAAATTAATNAAGNIQRLIDRGARNIVWNAPGNSALMPIPFFTDPTITPQQDAAWTETFFQQAQQQLAPSARAGVRIFLFDYALLQARVAADPGRYGFAAADKCWFIFDGSTVPACLAQSPAAQNSHFYWDGIHLTSAGFALMARYMANQIDAPLTVVPQRALVLGAAASFVGGISGQLDASRAFSAYGMGGASPAGFGATPRKWSVLVGASHDNGDSSARSFASAYDYRATGGYVGLEYAASTQLRFGVQFAYTQPRADLAVQNARYNVDAYQFGGYASYAVRSWFADGVLAYGRQDLVMDRAGVIDTIRGKTHADTFSAAGRIGYLADAGPVRIGPIAALAFTGGGIDGYTEDGDSLVTNSVAHQDVHALTAEAGFQLRAPFATAGGVLSPFANLTLAREWGQSDLTVVTTQVTTPLLPVLTPANAHDRTYGKATAGMAAVVSSRVTATLGMVKTFGRGDGEDFGASAGVRAAF